MLAPMPESFLQWSELFSYLVTIFGLPLAIYVFFRVETRCGPTRVVVGEHCNGALKGLRPGAVTDRGPTSFCRDRRSPQNRFALKSAIACRISACVFITNGP